MMINTTVYHYQITQKIGEGGMGEVYLAYDTELHRKIVLKFLSSRFTSDPEFKARFKREARAAAALNHPNIVTIYDIGEFENRSYIAMEYIEGESLKELIAEKKMPPGRDAINLVIQICSGLSRAHREGIVHRDIKPANILIAKDGLVKIVDFGLATLQDAPKLTREGTTLGTPHYMSPEQVRGGTDGKLDRRSDIFSVGVLLYELLTGEPPFTGVNELAVLFAIVNNTPLPLAKYNPEISPGLQKIVNKALEKKPKARYQHIEEMQADLRRERSATSPAVEQSTMTILTSRLGLEPKPGFFKRRVWPISLSALGLILLVFLIVQWLPGLRGHQSKKSAAISASAELALATAPAGATVFLNGDSVGITPLQLPGATAGEIVIRLQKPGYRAIDTTVAVAAGRTAQIFFVLQPAMIAATRIDSSQAKIAAKEILPEPAPQAPSAVGGLSITSDPEGAMILLDGQNIGSTPHTRQNVKAGAHEIVLRKPGYKDYSDSVTVTPEQVSEVDVKLAALIGKLSVLVKPFGSIYIDGNPEKQNWNIRYSKDLPAGPHLLRAVHHTFGTWEKRVAIEPDKETYYEVDFNQQATLTITAFDESDNAVWAEIYVDNKSTGQATPKQLSLRIGLHTIEVRREGYQVLEGAKILNIENDVKEPFKFTLRKI